MFDPNLPQAGTEIGAVQMRAQLTGLKDLIDVVPTITSDVVDAVDTLPAGGRSHGLGIHHRRYAAFDLWHSAGRGEGCGAASAQDLADGLETRAHVIPSVGTLEATAESECCLR